MTSLRSRVSALIWVARSTGRTSIERFFCPCHNGAFDPQGRATEGPPAAAEQSLTRFPLKVENGLLYIQVPLDAVSTGQAEEGSA